MNNIKKIALIIFISVPVIASLLMYAGCKPVTTNLKFATGGVSGTYYPYGLVLSKLFDSKIPNVNVSVQTTGASIENIKLISGLKSDIAIVQNDVLSYAYSGTGSFKGKPAKGISTIATLYMEAVQIVVSAENNINTIEDLKGKRISVGDIGSGVEANAIHVLSGSKLTLDDLILSNLSFKDSGVAFKKGKIDGFFITSGIPNAIIQDISQTKPLKILSIPKQEITRLLASYPFYIPYTMPKDVYTGVTEEVGTIAVKATLIVRENLDDDLVYDLTKTIFENSNEIEKSIHKGKELDINSAVKGLSVSLHPGAMRYYKEKGIYK
jgi:TRAP transporter TAXI family solute receptor